MAAFSVYYFIQQNRSCYLDRRQSIEEAVLKGELAGYTEYCGRVKYRILPGIW